MADYDNEEFENNSKHTNNSEHTKKITWYDDEFG
jgi:hypothetical protein